MGFIKRGTAVATAVLTIFCSQWALGGLSVSAAGDTYKTITAPSAYTRLQDDFFQGVNAEWLGAQPKNATRSIYGNCSSELAGVQLSIGKEFIAQGRKDGDKTSEASKYAALYESVMSLEERNNQGAAPLKPGLKLINGINKVSELPSLARAEVPIKYTYLVFSHNVSPLDASKIALVIEPPKLLVSQEGYYTNPSNYDSDYFAKAKSEAAKYFVLVGYTQKEADVKVDLITKLEARLAPYLEVRSSETASSRVRYGTVKSLDSTLPKLEFGKILKSMGSSDTQAITIPNFRVLQELNTMFTDSNLPMLKAYLELENIISAAPYLGSELAKLNPGETSLKKGVTERSALDFTYEYLWPILDKVYANKYFSASDKADVLKLYDEIKAVYKGFLQNLDWMSSETKTKAVDKLEKMKVLAVYPEVAMNFDGLSLKTYSEGGNLLENLWSIDKFFTGYVLKELAGKPSEAAEFYINNVVTFDVNAYYIRARNIMALPGGGMVSPFYGSNISKEEKLAGVGFYIAHEIGHAFDMMGSYFDSYGRVVNWWTKTDREKFQKVLDQNAAFYDKISFNGMNLDGQGIINETMADFNAMASLIALMDGMKNPNYDEFFRAYARNRRSVTTVEGYSEIVTMHPYAPDKVRINMILAQFQRFYNTYGITEKDAMYVPTQQRLRPFNTNPSPSFNK